MTVDVRHEAGVGYNGIVVGSTVLLSPFKVFARCWIMIKGQSGSLSQPSRLNLAVTPNAVILKLQYLPQYL